MFLKPNLKRATNNGLRTKGYIKVSKYFQKLFSLVVLVLTIFVLVFLKIKVSDLGNSFHDVITIPL